MGELLLRTMLDDLADKEDAWIRETAQRMGMTVQALAEQYALEASPFEIQESEAGTFRVTRTVRLVRLADREEGTK